jgi:N-acetylglucosamine kinase-like BadF-type ATPase
MENDVVGAWAAGTAASTGVVVIAGTGSTALGMNQIGQFWRTDGWDYVLGDSGSGYAIGHAGIRAAIKALDGRVPPTRIVRELAETYSVQTAEDMRRLWDSTRFGKFEIASFASHVSKAAAEGDLVAQNILRQAGRDLAEQTVAIIRILGMESSNFPVVTVGGVFKSGRWVHEPFAQGIHAVAPGAVLRSPMHPPQVGAAILAQRRLKDNDIGSWTLGTGNRQIRRSLRIDEMRIV